MIRLNKNAFWVVGFLVATVFATGLVMGKGSRPALSAENETFEELKIFTEVLSLTQKNYVEEVDSKELVYGAIRGMLGTLDPHSVFMTPEMYREVQVDTKGEFGGLGIQISIRDNRLTVIAPIEDTPAFRAGIQAGDWISHVDNEATKDMTLMDAVQKMRGPRGTDVTLTIQRKEVEGPMSFTIMRDIIRIQSVRSRMLEDSIGYVRINQFQERTGEDLEDALEELSKSGMKSLVLDLRNNPGGLLKAALEVSEQFLPSGKLIVYTKARDGKREEYHVGGSPDFGKEPMIVLVNGGSASASEIVAGALQDWGRAVILGTTTFGKASVQTILPLTDNSGLRLTTAKYFTPKDRSIHNTGIEPDIVVQAGAGTGMGPVPPGPEGAPDLEGHPGNDGAPGDIGDDTGAESEPLEVEDVQLEKAVDLLKSWRIFEHLRVAKELKG